LLSIWGETIILPGPLPDYNSAPFFHAATWTKRMTDGESINDLIELLDLEEIEQNHYRGRSPSEGWQRV